MPKKKYCYLVRVAYLGFRFSGWQKQPGQLTLEEMLLKTLKYVLPEANYKILGAGRTDAKVSSLNGAFELFLDTVIGNISLFKEEFNRNLPPDIQVLSVEEISSSFNIIQDVHRKEYVYLFSHGQKNHPYCAPFMAGIIESLDIDIMKEAAMLFEGTHDFKAYTAAPKKNAKTERTVLKSCIKQNELLSANFFPKESYAFVVQGLGFGRYQVRKMMGALVEVGKGERSLDEIKTSLLKNNDLVLTEVMPGSGLHLSKLQFNQ